MKIWPDLGVAKLACDTLMQTYDDHSAMDKAKIIFTDIDGVFHDGNTQLFVWAEYLWDLIAPYRVMLVIHSSWRHTNSLDEIRSRFPSYLKERILACTEGADPYESVMRFVEMSDVSDFIVIDDDVSRFPSDWIAGGRFILCETGSGLSSRSVLDRIRKFLSEEQSIDSENS